MTAARARAARIGALCSALCLAAAPAAAQHEHHGTAPAQLEAVNVSVRRDAVVLRSGSTVVYARGTGLVSGSVADILRTVPGIEVDADARVSVRGGASVLVLINGRPVTMSDDGLRAFLRQMPAAALERIETGTTASAGQVAEGADGLINLVFRDNARREGMKSLAGSMATEDHYMASTTMAGHAGDMVNWDVMYSLSGTRPRIESASALSSVVPGDSRLQTDQVSRAREKHRLHSVMIGSTVRPTSRMSLALRGTHNWMEGTSRSHSRFTYRNEAGDTDASATGSLLEHVIPSGEVSATFRLDRETLRYSSEGRHSFAAEEFGGIYYDEAAGYSYMAKAMTSRHREYVLRNDISLSSPILDVDFGHESRFGSVQAAHEASHFNVAIRERYGHELDVHGGYLTVRRSSGSLAADAGLRVEGDRRPARTTAASEATSTRLFPSIAAQWTDMGREMVYRLAYGRRINLVPRGR